MLHMKIDPAAAGRRAVVLVVAGAAACLDQLAFAAEGLGFLRAAWFEATADSSLITVVARRRDGAPAAAIPLVARKPKAARLSEVPGCYWPFRSLPVAGDCGDAELQALLRSPRLGRAWRWGPVPADDPALVRFAGLAAGSGWTLLRRRIATTYRVDLKRLTAEGTWPSTKTLRKNRWLERRLAEQGDLEFQTVGGAAWKDDVLDVLAAIEAESWVAQKGDTKFVDPARRRIWARALQDPALAAMLSCSVLRIGGAPAAFTFSVASGTTRYYIANGYSDRFAEGSPGRILLYRDFAEAAAAGVETIGWGAGDPGYKTEMGAEPGPDLVDCLFVRGRLAGALARPFWERRG
ncbi:GNAT family N-acetyltransferase [Sphingosinicella sp.]|uniref:GNAT family N-acetyltransferase n=1 Tax=Sphingosinicella sp. TaxID=1917971 RepID=UPI004038194A